ncbi:hypothetical protein JB92DRAFT_571668 [Gautieria morchelliformis]|nr:hypothetical protein JB92DRAFT_571668 [Gautieria morchelliformis]
MSLSITQSSTRHLPHVDLAGGIDGPRPSDSLVYATGQAFSGPSHRDPHAATAFDRWTSLVEVCASIRPTSLNALGPASSPLHFTSPFPDNPPLCLLPTSMVRAAFSDTEDEPRATLANSNEHGMIPRNRKRHACELCDKAFDRPSTLKTHLLVHTGITPFSCHICGRRFGVQSNCNRHIKRCAIREERFLARRSEFQALQSETNSHFPQIQPTTEKKLSGPRSPSPHNVSKPKRPRRKRSPSVTWIPHSLASFTISTTSPPAPLPLPPVRPKVAHEERDSYMSHHAQPYTEEGWSGRLPGPAPLSEHGYASVFQRRYSSRD